MSEEINFNNLSFEDFQELAKNPLISRHERVGFPNNYREGREKLIFEDVHSKLTNLHENKKIVMEIGPGCSMLPIMLADLCASNGSDLIYIDSAEMLSHLPNGVHIIKCAGSFPTAFEKHESNYEGKIDVIIAYSVIQYIFTGGNLWDFLDRCLILLANGGEILLGDIPNISMKKRFFSSEAGYLSHSKFTGSDAKPEVTFNNLERGQMDDSVVISIISRARSQGFHAWVVPQSKSLPMANRREDILIRKP
jgi:hypothetical protein